MKNLKDMNPVEAIELLKDLHRQRCRTRELARTVVSRDDVKGFIDQFETIEKIVLDEIVDRLGVWYTKERLELEELRNRLKVLEEANNHPLVGDHEQRAMQ